MKINYLFKTILRRSSKVFNQYCYLEKNDKILIPVLKFPYEIIIFDILSYLSRVLPLKFKCLFLLFNRKHIQFFKNSEISARYIFYPLNFLERKGKMVRKIIKFIAFKENITKVLLYYTAENFVIKAFNDLLFKGYFRKKTPCEILFKDVKLVYPFYFTEEYLLLKYLKKRGIGINLNKRIDINKSNILKFLSIIKTRHYKNVLFSIINSFENINEKYLPDINS